MQALRNFVFGSLVILASLSSELVSAQIVVPGPPVLGPRIVARPVDVAPVVHYRPVTPVRVAPYPIIRPMAVPYAYSPRVISPPVRTAYFGASAYGLPRAYVAGQPLRNRIRFFRP